MAKNKDVSFIRRNGRVIPIRKKDADKSLIKRPGAPPPPKKKERKSLFKASGLFGAGVLTSLFGGSAIAEFGKEASFRKDASIGLFKRGTRLKKQAESIAAGTTSIPQKDLKFLKQQSKTFTRAGAFQRSRGAAIGKTGKVIGGVAITAGSTLIGMGLAEAYEKLVGRKATDTENFIAYAAGSTATTLAAFELGKKTGVSTKAAKKVIAALLKRGG